MTLTLSYREGATLLAALEAWRDPISFASNGAGERFFVKAGGKLQPNEVEFLLRRMKSMWNAMAYDRT